MGKVAASIRVMPDSEETDLKTIEGILKETIRDEYYIGSINIEELAFGLRAIKLVVVMDDREGLIDKLERRIKEIKGVGEIDIEEVSLIS